MDSFFFFYIVDSLVPYTVCACTSSACIGLLGQLKNILHNTSEVLTLLIEASAGNILEELLRFISLVCMMQVLDRGPETDFTRVHNKIAVVSTRYYPII